MAVALDRLLVSGAERSSRGRLALKARTPRRLRKVRMAFTSLSSVMCPPWIAREAGIFNKHGLDVEVIATPTGVEGMNALIAGEVQFLQISGGTTASAALGGADVIVVGTTLDSLVQSLMVRPEIEKAEQLKGKALGITRFGTSIDVGARLALSHFGLVPEKDVAIVQVGGMESMVTALQTNRIQAGILSYPAITQALKLGHRVLLDVASLGVPYAFTGMTTRGRLIREDADLVRRYMMAQTEAIARAKRDKNIAVKVMGKYLRTADPGGARGVLRDRRAKIYAARPADHRRSDEIRARRSRRSHSQGQRRRAAKVLRRFLRAPDAIERFHRRPLPVKLGAFPPHSRG